MVTAVAGVAGIAWQAHVAQVQRSKAQAQSEDLRQLSVSLLTELDEAIKQLPGSTSAQKLLVTRVLEHLDRMSKNGDPDKPTALNLADAYTRVANLEGNPYDQNIGDAAGGLVSINKAVSLTEQWKAKDPSDVDALHAFAFARQSQAEILFGMGRMVEAVQAMKLAASAYATLAARADSTPTRMSDASSAYGALGDQLGMLGKGTLGDFAGALAAYQTALEYQKKALRLDPNWPRSRRTLPVALLKIGNMEFTTDPWEALRQFKAALEAMDHYPIAEKGSFNYKRTYSAILRRLGVAFTEVRQYGPAISSFEAAKKTNEEQMRADPQDTRSRIDLVSTLDNEALVYEALASDPEHASERVKNRRQAQLILEQMLVLFQEITKRNPQDLNNRENLAHTQVRIGTLQQGTTQSREGAQLAAQGLLALQEFAKHKPEPTYLDDMLSTSLISVEPATLRNPKLAVEYAEHAVALSPRRPSYWCNLAQAYRAAGAPAATRQKAAMNGLALLGPVRPGESSSSTRKELEAEAR